MRLLLCVGVLVLCTLSGLLGLTAGINLNPSSTISFVPNWGSVGDWLAGLGAFCAVAASLWLARRRDDIRITQAASSSYVAIRVVSHGIYPVTIKKILLSRGSQAFDVPLAMAETRVNFPARLEPRDEIEIILPVAGMITWLEVIQRMNARSLNEIHLEVWMPAGSSKVPLGKSVKATLQKVAEAHDIAVTS